MKNEELKKKICKIIAPYVSAWGEDERIADALIAAQIGDVSELKNHRLIAEYSLIPEDGNSYVLPNTPLRITQLYSGEEVEKIVKERDEYKHRAEVAEKALQYAVSKYRCDECPCLDCNAEIRGSQECIDLIVKTYKESAEMELKKEKDND